MKAYQHYIGLAFQWGLLLGLAVWGGLKADAHWNLSPLFIILLPLIALAYLFYNLLKTFGHKK